MFFCVCFYERKHIKNIAQKNHLSSPISEHSISQPFLFVKLFYKIFLIYPFFWYLSYKKIAFNNGIRFAFSEYTSMKNQPENIFSPPKINHKKSFAAAKYKKQALERFKSFQRLFAFCYWKACTINCVALPTTEDSSSKDGSVIDKSCTQGVRLLRRT